ncbi:MAG: hypothetical protein DMG65_02460 [Candidatus Angelobacter sp. Gp1-AA117]|nr:MAG: hypothetical protein DMG65_02460 [Candidatus Angelobacter sp. Gp1-AA117]
MSLFSGLVTIGVNDVAAATAWYKEKFGLRESGQNFEEGSPEDTELISSPNREFGVILLAGVEESGDPPPVLNTSDIAKAREWLALRGVNVTPVQTDRQGTHYIEMRDLENNLIEISEEP